MTFWRQVKIILCNIFFTDAAADSFQYWVGLHYSELQAP